MLPANRVKGMPSEHGCWPQRQIFDGFAVFPFPPEGKRSDFVFSKPGRNLTEIGAEAAGIQPGTRPGIRQSP